LYYYRARYYDPSIGRFISSDPIEFLAGDVNFYRYVGGDPVNFVDPSGLAAPALYGAYLVIVEAGVILGEAASGAWAWVTSAEAISVAATTLRVASLISKVKDLTDDDIDKLSDEEVVAIIKAEGLNVKGKEGLKKCRDAKQKKKKMCESVGQIKVNDKGFSPSEIKAKLKRNRLSDVQKKSVCTQVQSKRQSLNDCLNARKDVTDKCYGGVLDATHAKEEEDLNAGLNNLDKIKNLGNCK
jgi:uncharacterized protein RhaS with RHS repeats